MAPAGRQSLRAGRWRAPAELVRINDYGSLQVACTTLPQKGDETESIGQSKRTKKNVTEKNCRNKDNRRTHE